VKGYYTSGTGKEIVWTITQDVALHQYGESYVVVMADDRVERAKQITWEKGGSEMVLIPGESFQMGDAMNEPEVWMKRLGPAHTVELGRFYMDVNEVTGGKFRKCEETA